MLLEQNEAENVKQWRWDELVQAGWPNYLAAKIAVRFDIDIHKAIEMTDKGCPFKVAAEILL